MHWTPDDRKSEDQMLLSSNGTNFLTKPLTIHRTGVYILDVLNRNICIRMVMYINTNTDNLVFIVV